MSSWVDAIAATLTAAGVVDGSWPAHKLRAQPSPNQAITIYEVGGQEPVGKDRRVLRPAFQVVARAAPGADKAASDKAHAARAALDHQAVAGFGMFMATQSSPLTLGPDDQGRPRFTVNFRGIEA